MAANAGDILTLLKLEIGRDTSAIDSLFYEWLNTVSREWICEWYDFWFMKSSDTYNLAATEYEHAYPSDYKDDIGLYYKESTETLYQPVAGPVPLSIVSQYSTTDTGHPRNWHQDPANHANYRIWPISDDTYNMLFYYLSKYDKITVPGGTNYIITDCTTTLMEGLKSLAFAHLQEWTDSKECLMRFQGQNGKGGLRQDLKVASIKREMQMEMQLFAGRSAADVMDNMEPAATDTNPYSGYS